MSKKTIDDVIDQIEGKKENIKSHLESEWNDVKKLAEKEPLVTLTIVGVIAFLLGWIFGSRRK